MHPVTSPAAYTPGEAAVEPWGLDGGRRRMLVDAGGTAVTQRQQPRTALVSAVPCRTAASPCPRRAERR
ncbi:MOSC N-terminal beta barrel domain-containing protein [Streptomyces sp. A1277]|uniref:MOSC N-terminal beta barrel domain-containing protein n=1 Tax=Streptomyces sp. A1277 TaxID=2563103 RepID=UPI0023EF564B|nr:MOSC N-terminal beta barrel domain-containing protein [Streptomyces sp. A1277]